MAVKRTWELIPLCHPLLLDHCALELDTDAQRLTVTAECTVRCTGRTGVEMEALQGVTTALLTVYDMCKALSHENGAGPDPSGEQGRRQERPLPFWREP